MGAGAANCQLLQHLVPDRLEQARKSVVIVLHLRERTSPLQGVGVLSGPLKQSPLSQMLEEPDLRD